MSLSPTYLNSEVSKNNSLHVKKELTVTDIEEVTSIYVLWRMTISYIFGRIVCKLAIFSDTCELCEFKLTIEYEI